MLPRISLAVVIAFGLLGSTVTENDTPIAPRLDGLGDYHYKVTTDSSEAQAFFDQGLRLTYGFNHAEAIRAFREAARLDSNFAMAHWGQALALGPNINDPMPHERQLKAVDALNRAVELAPQASEKERAFIDALKTRYSTDESVERAQLDGAYAEAMRSLLAKYPNDSEAATLFAAAAMNTMPWNYWKDDLSPREGTAEVLDALEGVLAANPDHPGAHHYYIHIVEASAAPDRGVTSAEKLAELMPGSGHLVHMPSHIYLRVGRYAEASDTNELAILADEDYIAQCQAQGLYPIAYYPHNIHFLWSTASLEGRSEVAIDAAEKTAAKVPVDMATQVGSLQSFLVTPLFAFVRFGRWNDVLTAPPPAADMPFAMGIWHYARGVAFAARNDLERADEELAALEKLVAMPEMETLMVNNATAAHILRVAAATVAGEVAAEAGRVDEAIDSLNQAVEHQDQLPYMEPPNWHYSVRQSLGAVLLDAGRLEEAERVYREDLEIVPHNGWSLYGLLQTLREQGQTRQADEVAKRLNEAWARADVTLTASRF